MNSEEIRKQLAQQQANKQAAATPATPDLQGKVNDYSDYINEMHRAQQEAARAELEAAYKQNVAAIDRAGVGVDKTYQDAKNQATGASERAKRNFAQYATANGLNNGAGGQAELARSVELQKALGALDRQKAQTVADLDLQRTNAATDYNSAIAKAKAEGNYQLAQALYQEKVRKEEALASALQQEYQNELNKYQLDYQTERDQMADDQWQKQYEFAKQQYIDQLALEHGKNAGATSWSDAGTSGNNGVIGTGGGKSVAEVAQEVIAGQWGIGAARRNALAQAGYDYNAVQSAVDSLMAGGVPDDNAGAGISENPFTSFLTLVKYQVGNGFENAAYANVGKMWPQLSVQQRQAVQNMLAQYGLAYQ